MGQNKTINGYIIDDKTGEKLIGASLYNIDTKQGTTTDNYGFYSLTFNSTILKLRISYVGYETLLIDKQIKSNENINFSLKPNNQLQEVIIKAQKEKPIGFISIPIERLKKIPPLFGEVDILKALTLTPGVMAGTEGSSGLFVRGGTPDQNLILLDDAPVYNASHFGGFLSVFNPNSIKNIDLYKGAFPAQFGGKLSSVIDITMKDGNNKKIGGEYNMGLINQNLTVEGPIGKKEKSGAKSSFIISGRYSNLGLSSLFKSRTKTGTGSATDYQFYDFNAKFNTEITKKDHLFLSLYTGYDYLTQRRWAAGINSTTKINWGNTTTTFRYNRIINPKLFSKFSVIYAAFDNNQKNSIEDETLTPKKTINQEVNSSVKDVIIKERLDYFVSTKQSFIIGADWIKHSYQPSKINTNVFIPLDTLRTLNATIPATETAIYAESKSQLSSWLGLNLGLRYVNFSVDNKNYNGFEPRVSANINLKSEYVLKASYTKMRQFIHLLTNNGAGLSNDIWVPSTGKIPPQIAEQFSLGLNKDLFKNAYELTIEGYYKRMNNLIDYPEGTSFISNFESSWQNIVDKNGKGRTYGFEAMITKNKGNLNGWASYTISKSERIFENINLGNWYPSKYDRRHVFNITGSYDFSKTWKINGSFVYQSGHAITLPVASLDRGGFQPKVVYNGRNLSRMPNYHRMDIGASRIKINKKGKETTLSFGVYNLYNKANAYYIDLSYQYDTKKTVIKQYSLIPFLPYISYSSKF
jgi:CarboxypepD_reg-like domain/TonB-dependent Receptor Plug Domain